MVTSLRVPQLTKEARALGPIWLGAILAVIVGDGLGAVTIPIVAFAVGAIALGAHSLGHEYGYRTLPTLLAQPANREGLLATKFLVLIPSIAMLAIASWVLVLAEAEVTWRVAILSMTLTLAVGVAPWLALVCRGTMPGLVFTLAVPSILWIAGEIARAVTLGFTSSAGYRPALTLMAVGVVVSAVIATAIGWHQFLRLEAIDGFVATGRGRRIRSLQLPRSRRPRLMLLAMKELRLQGLAIAIAALYAGGWIALRLARADLQVAGQSFEVLSALYCAFIAVLVGAAASADERALGVIPSQVVQPYATWKQWLVKAAVTVGVAIALGPGLATVLEAGFSLIADGGRVQIAPLRLAGFWINTFGVSTAVLASIALHISSLSTTGVRALMWALPYSLSLVWLYTRGWAIGYRAVSGVLTDPMGSLGWWRALPTAQPADFAWTVTVNQSLGGLLLVGLVVTALTSGLRNHRSAPGGGLFAAKQMLGMATYAAVAGVLMATVPALVMRYLLSIEESRSEPNDFWQLGVRVHFVNAP